MVENLLLVLLLAYIIKFLPFRHLPEFFFEKIKIPA